MAFDFVYPADDLAAPDGLLSLMGSFWSATYQGDDLVRSLLSAFASLRLQSHRDLQELASAVSRRKCPVAHVDAWMLFPLREVDRNSGNLPIHDGTFVFGAAGYQYGLPVNRPGFAYPLPAQVVDLPVLQNRIDAPSRTLVSGIDYRIDTVQRQVVFREDPLADDQIPRRGVAGEQEAVLWGYRVRQDRHYITNQFGYALGLDRPDSPAFRDLVNAMLDAIVFGTTDGHLRRAFSACCGAPLATGDEVVELIRHEVDRLLVITDRNVYAYGAAAEAVVAVGDAVTTGDTLADSVQFYGFNRGQVPDADEVPALTLGRGLLAAGFFADLVFENKDVALEVSYDSDGYAMVRFEIGGWPADVDRFFELLHEKGRAAGRTLAHLLDRRPAGSRDTEPDALALPPTINPLAFLCQNVLRNHVQLVRLRPAGFGPQALGTNVLKSLRRLVPPHALVLILTILEHDDHTITADDPGTEEAVTPYLGLAIDEAIDPAEVVTEQVWSYRVGGHCA